MSKEKGTPKEHKGGQQKRPGPEILDNFLWNLFNNEGGAVFCYKNQSITNIEDFLKKQSVQAAAATFINALLSEWEKEYPDLQSLDFDQELICSPNLDEEGSREVSSISGDKEQLAGNSRVEVLELPSFDDESELPHKSHNEKKKQSGERIASSEPAGEVVKPGKVPPETQPPRKVKRVEPSFRLPNCRVGQSYEGKLECDQKHITIEKVEVPQDQGLVFNLAENTLVGVPSVSGEITIRVFWRVQNDELPGVHATSCILISNPDPRSLWQVKEPSEDLPYRKPHLDSQLHKHGDKTLIGASRRGRSHEHSGTFRDDDFFLGYEDQSDWGILMVADGAGSAEFSREGSKIAVQTAGGYLKETLDEAFLGKLNALIDRWGGGDAMEQIGSEFHYLYHGMATQAVQRIEQEAKDKGSDARQFSTTLLTTLIRPVGDELFVASFWMGDGAIAAYGPEGTVKVLGTPDGGEYAGQTRFLDRAALADKDFGKRVRIGKLAGVEAVILMTDGVSDPYFETDNGLLDPKKWDRLWSEIEPKLKGSNAESDLLEWLHFFIQGHHDDRTIAAWW
jgi:hypothetical protein